MNYLFNTCKSVIYLNGNICYVPIENLPIIATDGAYTKLDNIGITPNFVVGDFDSVDLREIENCDIIECYDQNYTDFEKAINFAVNNNFMPAIVSGVNGNNIDHVLNNFNIIVKNKCFIYDDAVIGCVVDKHIVFNTQINTKISIIGFSANISSSGLRWELSHAQLCFPGQISCSNRAVEEKVKIIVHSGVVLVIMHKKYIKDKGCLDV